MRLTVSAFCTGLALSLFSWSPGKAQIIVSTPLVVFSANDGDHGAELWVTNGTAAGTRLLMDIVPGSSGSAPIEMTATDDGRAFFSASSTDTGRELWVTDGTREGTRLVKDIFVGGSGSVPVDLTYVGSGRVAFAARDIDAGREAWISDGTEAGTFRLVNSEPGYESSFPGDFARLDDKVFMFTASRNGERRIWISDGTADGTMMLPGPLRGGYHFSLMDDGRVLFAAGHPTRGGQAWVYDLASGSRPTLLKNLNRDEDAWPYAFERLGNGSFVFSANHPNRGYQPFVTDGTRAGTSMLRPLSPSGVDSNPQEFTPLNSAATHVVFSTQPNPTGSVPQSVWLTDGTRSGTTRLKNGLDVLIGDKVRLADGVVLMAGVNTRNAGSQARGKTLWVTDGTRSGTTEIFRPNGGQPNTVSHLTPIGGGIALFRGFHRNRGAQPYITDGTSEGTSLLTRINLSGSANPEDFAVIRRIPD